MTKRLVDPSKLYDEGWTLLDDGEIDKALEIGERLERLRWTGAFELQAAAHEQKGDLDTAIATLQRGIEKAGGPYLLFSRLGNYLSDAEQFDEALAAYDRGLACEPTDPALFGLNRSLVYSRMDRDEDALAELRRIEPTVEAAGANEPIYWHFRSSLVGVLRDLGRYDEIADCAEPVAAAVFSSDDFEESKASLAAIYAMSLNARNEAAASRRWLDRALELDRSCEQALWLKREQLSKVLAPGGHHYELMVEGRCRDVSPDGEVGTFGFFTTFSVVADSEQQALELVRPFVMEEARDKIAIAEVERMEATSAPKGVYECNPYNLFPPDASGEN